MGVGGGEALLVGYSASPSPLLFCSSSSSTNILSLFLVHCSAILFLCFSLHLPPLLFCFTSFLYRSAPIHHLMFCFSFFSSSTFLLLYSSSVLLTQLSKFSAPPALLLPCFPFSHFFFSILLSSLLYCFVFLFLCHSAPLTPLL